VSVWRNSTTKASMIVLKFLLLGLFDSEVVVRWVFESIIEGKYSNM